MCKMRHSQHGSYLCLHVLAFVSDREATSCSSVHLSLVCWLANLCRRCLPHGYFGSLQGRECVGCAGCACRVEIGNLAALAAVYAKRYSLCVEWE